MILKHCNLITFQHISKAILKSNSPIAISENILHKKYELTQLLILKNQTMNLEYFFN